MLAEIATMFSATTSAVDLAKGLKAAIDKVGDAETKLQMADLISKLAEAKLEAAAGVERIAALERQLSLTKSMTFDGELYWQEGEGDDREGPFCQRCFDDVNKAVRLQLSRTHGAAWECKVCNSGYGS